MQTLLVVYSNVVLFKATFTVNVTYMTKKKLDFTLTIS